MSSRDALRALLVAIAVVGVLPAYGKAFVGAGWWLPVMAATAAALTVAVVARGLRRGPIVSAVASLAVLVVTLPALVGITSSLALPRAEVRQALRALFPQALRELADTPAPTPMLPGLLLLVVVGFWVVPHVAHELLVRWRRPGAALIVITVLWAAPLLVPYATGPDLASVMAFLAAGALLLLVGGDRRERAGTLPVTGLGLGAVAIVVGLTVPGLLPGYLSPPWIVLDDGDTRGYQPIIDLSERLQRPEDVDVLRVFSNQRVYLRLAGLDSFDGFTWRIGPPDAEPGGRGGPYTPAPENLYAADRLLPPESPAASTDTVFVDVEVLNLENVYVPTPYQPVRVLGPTRDEMVWSTEGGVLATWDTSGSSIFSSSRVGVRQGVNYRVEAERPTPTHAQLSAVPDDPALTGRWTSLPRSYEALAATAEEVYEQAGATTTIDRILALQTWFVDSDAGFTYDLDVPALRDDDALERFVLEDRVGYCEYYATAMAVMLRATGIPARVAVGFLPGRLANPPEGDGDATTDGDEPADGTTEEPGPEAEVAADAEAAQDGEATDDAEPELVEYLVSTGDAHAWVEVLFPGYGWITFEPTPRSDGAQMLPRADSLAPLETEQERRTRERAELIASLGPNLPADFPLLFPEFDDDFGDWPFEDDEDWLGPISFEQPTPSRWPWLLLPGGLIALVVVAHVVRYERRPTTADGPIARILYSQRRMLSTADLHGVGRRPEETSRELAERWRREGRTDGQMHRFARIAQAAAFGGEVDDDVASEAERLGRDIELALRSSVGPGARRLARVYTALPGSEQLVRRVRPAARRPGRAPGSRSWR